MPVLRTLFVASLVPPLLAVASLAASGRPYWPHAMILTWYALASCAVLELARRKGWRVDVFLSLAVLHLAVLTPEILLRLADFRYEPGLRLERPGSHLFRRFVAAEGLFWTLPPGGPGVSPEGFATRPLPQPSEARAMDSAARVVFLGDSVEQQGYPETVEILLTMDLGTRCEVFNLSLAGYSSHQGRVLTEKYGDVLAADVAVISFGWNDHWLAPVSDAERILRFSSNPARRLAAAFVHRSRLAQAARWLADRPRRRPATVLRVSPERYRDNLVWLGRFWQDRGTRPLFLTLPSSHRHFGVPDYLVEEGLVKDLESAVTLHGAYSEIVREVAAEHDWPLLDLEGELAALDDRVLRQIFLDDGIHLTAAGTTIFAERTARGIAGLIETQPIGAQRPGR